MKKIIFILFLFVYTVNCHATAQQPYDSTQKLNKLKELRSDIEALLDNPDFSTGFIGINVQSIETGEYFYRLNDTKNFIPASTLKLLTTAASIDYLGKDFKFTTKLYLDGEIKENGEFVGNVIIRGGGDPTLSKYFHPNPISILDKWTHTLDSLGINSIKGNIIADDSYFDDQSYGPGWAWDDFQYTYSSQINALSINDNSVEINVSSGDSVGLSAKFSIYPENNLIRIINNVKTGKKGDPADVYIYRETGSNFIEIHGTIPYDSYKKNETVNLETAIDNPAMFFLNIFLHSLDKQRIRFNGSLLSVKDWISKIDYSNMLPVAIYQSPVLNQIIQVINKESHNLCTEMLLKTLGKESVGKGTFYNGVQQVLNFAAKAGISKEKIKCVDGSGLSRLNLISPRNMTSLMNYIYRSPLKDDLIESLAIPGDAGTLLRRMTKSRAEKSVKAKTGSMNNVCCITGYVTTRDKEVLAFSIMMEGFTVPLTLAQNLQDLILMRLASFSRN